MDELTTRQRLAYLLRNDAAEDEIGREEMRVIIEDHIAAIRNKSGGDWDKILAAEYVNDLEHMIESEDIDDLESEGYDHER